MSGLTSWEQVSVLMQDIEDSRRILICSPEWESRAKSMIAAHGVSGLWEVRVSPVVPDTAVYIVDPNAMDAALRQELQRAARDFRFGP